MEGRPAALVATCDQWVRATHERTAVEGASGDLVLTWEPSPLVRAPRGRPCTTPGLAVDRLCRLYTVTPTTVTRRVIGPTAHGLDYTTLPDPVGVIDQPGAAFTGATVDGDDRLFLTDGAGRTIAVLDLWSRRLLRLVATDSPAHPGRTPVSVAVNANDGAEGRTVFALLATPTTLWRLSATRGPTPVPLPSGTAALPAGTEPARVAVLHDGTPVLLFHEPGGDGWIVAGSRPPLAVGAVSDLCVDADGAVVLAPCPRPDGGATFRRLTPNGSDQGWTRTHPLDATGYDGGGVVATADGRILYSTAAGPRLAVIGRVTYERDGYCVTYRLDSGVPRNRWGRILLEACIPDQTACLVGAVTSDDEFETQQAHDLPEPRACTPVALVPTPPLPPLTLDAADGTSSTYRRGNPVTPWWYHDGVTATYEAPVDAPPGRYLWLTVRLRGNGRRTPRVHEVRVEKQAHALLRRLPRVFADDPTRADFLQRYLAPMDGLLHDLDLRARTRDLLVDPASTPAEALEWLASFVGLVLDRRWADAAKRRLVTEIVPLYRLRGTVWALQRYLEIYLAGERAMDDDHPWVSPVIIEHFRLRGVGGPGAHDAPAGQSRSVIGHGFRAGAPIGDPSGAIVDFEAGTTAPLETAFGETAHQFTVLIPQPLDTEQESAVRHILDTERPAHTVYELCTVDTGMRVGRGLHLGVSSIVGPTAGFGAAVTDRSLLGRGTILGGRRSGVALEAARVGTTARVG